MPDQYGFDHLPEWGVTYHRCIVEGCDYPGHGVRLTERQRQRHQRQHTREREKELEKERNANLAKGRKVRRQQIRERG